MKTKKLKKALDALPDDGRAFIECPNCGWLDAERVELRERTLVPPLGNCVLVSAVSAATLRRQEEKRRAIRKAL